MTLNARALLWICLASGCWSFSFGLGSQVVTHWLKAHTVDNTGIGLAHMFYYLGVAVGSCAVPWMNRRLGPIRCAVLGQVSSGLTLALFPHAGSLPLWFALRLCNGWAGAMSLVPLEAIVSRDSPPGRKTQYFGCYGLALTIGGALGIWIGSHFYVPGETFEFHAGGGVPVMASVMLAAGMRRHSHRLGIAEGAYPLGWGRNFLSYGTAWCQGFLEGGMLAFLSLFLLARGFSLDEAGTLMGVTMIGVILFQLPVAWLADRFGRTAILFGCYGVVALTLVGLPWLTQPWIIAVGLFCFGACSGAMYPLGLALLGDRTPEAGLARAYAWYLAVECVGSQLGAAAMGKARDHWGESAMFAVGLMAVLLVLAVWALLYMRHAPIEDSPGRLSRERKIFQDERGRVSAP